MKPTKRRSDPLGRSTIRHPYSRYLLSLAIAITGSVWAIQARSIEPIFDTLQRCAVPGCATRRAEPPTRQGPAVAWAETPGKPARGDALTAGRMLLS
jgi:hypothetical protein